MVGPNPSVMVEGSIFVAGCAFAFWKGGRPERIVSGAMLLELLADFGVQRVQQLEGPHYVALALDFGVLAAVLFVAFSTNLRWPLLASALQILSVLSYITRVIDPSIHSWAYVTVSITLGYALMATVIYGAITHMWRSAVRQ